MTTGPLHWTLLARGRAVDNQCWVAVCSPSRDLSASYHAWGESSFILIAFIPYLPVSFDPSLFYLTDVEPLVHQIDSIY